MPKSFFSSQVQNLRQEYPAECGLVALAGLAMSELDIPSPLPYLRSKTKRVNQGLSLADLVELGTDIGLRLAAVEATLEEIIEHGAIAILHWQEDHYVLLSPGQTKPKHVYIFDPECGCKREDTSTIKSGFRGYAIIFLGALEPVEPLPKFASKISKFQIARQFTDVFRAFGPLVLLSATVTILQMIAPLFVQIAIDRIVPVGSENFLFGLMIVFFALTIFKLFTTLLRGSISLIVERMSTAKFQKRLIQLYSKQAYSAIEGRAQGDVLTDFASAEVVSRFFSGAAIASVIDAFFVFVFLGILFLFSTTMAVLVISSAILISIIRTFFVFWERPLQQKAIQDQAIDANNFFDLLGSIEQLKIFSVIRGRENYWSHDFFASMNSNLKLSHFRLRANALYSFLEEASNILISGVGIYLILKGELTIGALYLVAQYRGIMFSKLVGVINTLQNWITIDIHISRFSYILKEENDAVVDDFLVKLDHPTAIAVRDLGFQYGVFDNSIFHSVNFEIKNGEKVLFCGPSGSGKTTLVKILTGLYTDFDGSVFVYGLKLTPETSTSIQKFTSGIFQGQHVSSLSIFENVRFFDDHLSEMQAVEALENAHCWDFVNELKMREHTPIGPDFGPLSSGQKQRVLAARVLAKNAPLTVLDEGTSHLDKKTERNVVTSLKNKLTGTLICIAHNIDAFETFDRVFWVEAGEIKEISFKIAQNQLSTPNNII
jgi:ATP-binding cassette subfamily B protein RaxB